MHELAMTQSVVDMVVERTDGRRVSAVQSPGRRPVRGRGPDAMLFCFDVATTGTAIEGAVLEIEQVKGRAHCRILRLGVHSRRPDPAVPLRERGRTDHGGQGTARHFRRAGGAAMCLTCGAVTSRASGSLPSGPTTALTPTATLTTTTTTTATAMITTTGMTTTTGRGRARRRRSSSASRSWPRTTTWPSTTVPGSPTHGITALNLMSSPGSGKTSLLERTIVELAGEREICVIEGDQETPSTPNGSRAAGRPCGPGQHRRRLPPRRPDGAARDRRRWPRSRFAAVHRERRQPGLSRPCSISGSRPRW